MLVVVAVPDNVEDEVAGCIHFAEEYTNRYGDTHPLFFQGTLDEGVREACNKPAREVSLISQGMPQGSFEYKIWVYVPVTSLKVQYYSTVSLSH